MAPLIALIGGFAVLRVLGLAGVDALDGWQPAVRGGLALMFFMTGVAHFVGKLRADMIRMVPPRLPNPTLLVNVTGVLEILGAIGLLIPATARFAAIGLALLLVLMFPANVSAARRELDFGGRPATPLPRRTAEQVLYVAAAVLAAL
ncbi:DoxX family membrane protein [Phytomonospora sp. NPDC050363]|uniref:DoxX family protein n=1 Tax=Phytomonospora sp. NPDC050363 TaxID=3155642 RepID=UPI0033E584FB